MKYYLKYFLVIIFLACILPAQSQTKAGIDVWLTNPDKSSLFAHQDKQLQFGALQNNYPVINVNDKQTYQSMVGFGFALTGGSAMHMISMNAESRAKLLHEIFATDSNNIGVSYLRVSIGSSDLNDHVFSYDDLPAGETDMAMKKFNLGPDRKDVIPVLKEILAINPAIKILGSPWSPPAWMKTNHDTRGGRLKPEYYAAYAKYFVKYIQQMKAEGITIDAITVQNEPLHPGNNPSLLLTAPEEKDFVKNNLGPAFKTSGIHTTISIYVHNAHPEKNIYFTEQMVVQFHDTATMHIASPVRDIIIGATRNWCRNVLLWNLAAGPDFKPFTDRGGCSMCQGAVTIDSNLFTKNIAYYAMAHVSKFVRPGSVRVASNDISPLPNVAFTTPSGKKVLIVANDSNELQTFMINYHGKNALATLPGKAVATYVW